MVRREYGWKGVRLEECKIVRVQDWKNARLEACDNVCVILSFQAFQLNRICNFLNFYLITLLQGKNHPTKIENISLILLL